jgi:lipid-A-disaccharide synthase
MHAYTHVYIRQEDDLGACKRVQLSRAGSYKILTKCQAAFVTSGTATLETALLGVPQVVCYTGSRISYEIARRVIKVKYISLVNLILDKPFLRELIQFDFNAQALHESLVFLLDPTNKNYFKAGYEDLKQLLLTEEIPSHHAARLIAAEFKSS